MYLCLALPGHYEAERNVLATGPGLMTVCSTHHISLCGRHIPYADMTTVFDRVWAVGILEVIYRLFSMPQQPKAGVATYRCIVDPARGGCILNEPKRGTYPNLVDATGCTLA